MLNIPSFSHTDIGNLMEKVREQYLSSGTTMFKFADWQQKFLVRGLNSGDRHFGLDGYDLDDEGYINIKIAPSERQIMECIHELQEEFNDLEDRLPGDEFVIAKLELFKERLPCQHLRIKPEELKIESLVGDGSQVPIWFNRAHKTLNIRLGILEGDSSKPYPVKINDDSPHMILGGVTGSGKSVAIHTCISNMLLEYAPWELELVLCDFKMVELPKYCSPNNTPQVSVIGATADVGYIASLYKDLNKRLELRKEIFSEFGINSLPEWLNRTGITMPRILLLVDELAAMFMEIKAREDANAASASESRSYINNALDLLAIQGRAFGMNMFISSQKLDDLKCIEQFGTGISLKADSGVSKLLIKNPEGAKIKTAGWGVANQQRFADGDNSMYNRKFQIPYLKVKKDNLDDLREKTDISKIVYELGNLTKHLREEYGVDVDKDTQLYDENKLVRFSKMKEDIAIVDEMEKEKRKDPLYDMNTFAEVVLGRTTEYRTGFQADYLTVERKRNSAIIVSADKPEDLDYILTLLRLNMDSKGINGVVVPGKAETVARFCKGIGSNYDVRKIGEVPKDILDKIKTRIDILNFNNKMINTLPEGEYFNKDCAYKSAVELFGSREEIGSLQKEAIMSFIESSQEKEFNPTEDYRSIQDSLKEKYSSEFSKDQIEGLLMRTVGIVQKLSTVLFATKKLTNFERELKAHDFEPEVVWFLGIDDMSDLNIEDNYQVQEEYKQFFSGAGYVNILPIISIDKTKVVGRCLSQIDYYIEKSGPEKVMEIIDFKKVNLNDNTIATHRRGDKSASKRYKKYKVRKNDLI